MVLLSFQVSVCSHTAVLANELGCYFDVVLSSFTLTRTAIFWHQRRHICPGHGGAHRESWSPPVNLNGGAHLAECLAKRVRRRVAGCCCIGGP